MIKITNQIIGSALCIGLLSACGGGSDKTEQEILNEKVREIITANDLTGDPSIGRELPDITSPKAQLGMKLFFTKALGGERDAACVTCHHPALGGGDDLSLPIGVDAQIPDLLGPGRFVEPCSIASS